MGAGVIGLLTARELALAGLRVTLVDRGESGREESWAGGGIVSPLYPWRYSPAVTALAHWSQDFYPALGPRLLDETGLDPEVQTVGLCWLDLDDQPEALHGPRKHTRPLK
ncbi:NAD(P)/FAD-dependent oxidoreductase, partial [Pseudomonas aeruginosa]